MNVVKFVQDVVDFGNTPEIFVTVIASITRVSAGVIRETFYVDTPSHDGRVERRVALTILWDAEQWLAARRAVAAADPHHVPSRAEGESLVH
jgi:hypothetical protein